MRRLAGPAPVVLLLAILSSSSAASADTLQARPRSSPLRAQLARQIVSEAKGPDRLQFPNDGDGGSTVDGSKFWWIGSVSPDTYGSPSSGLSALIEEIDTPPDGTGCFDCWTSAYLDNGLWGQIGFATCRMPGHAPNTVTFYQVWDTNPSPAQLLVDANTQISAPGLHSYAMSAVDGTVWAYAVDGTVFGLYDMGANTASGAGALGTMCEEGDGMTAPFSPTAVSIPVAMSLLDNGTWTGASTANVINTSGISGVAGNLQDSTLANGALRIGGASAYAASGTTLWSGPAMGFSPDAGPAGAAVLAPPRLHLSQPQTAATVSGVVTLSGTVDCSPTTTPVADVAFLVEDLQGNPIERASAKAAPYQTSWDTTLVPDAAYLIFMEVRDTAGLETYVDIEVTVRNSGGNGTGTGGAGSTGTGGVFREGSGMNGTGGMGPRSGPASTPLRASRGCSSGMGAASPALALLLLGWRRRDWLRAAAAADSRE